MAEVKADDTSNKSMTQQLALARLLLLNYQQLHSAIVMQLELYPTACCNISLDGDVRINPEDRSVEFYVRTRREYYLSGKTVIKRDKYSPLGKLMVRKKRYDAEKRLAELNLTDWCRKLMWPDTKVHVYFDQEIKIKHE